MKPGDEPGFFREEKSMKEITFFAYLDGYWGKAETTTKAQYSYRCPICGTLIEFYPHFVAFDGMDKNEIMGEAHCPMQGCTGAIPYKITIRHQDEPLPKP